MELLDKDGNVIGSGTTDSTGHATITPTVPILGNVTVKATDNAEHQIVLRLILLKQLIQRHQLFPNTHVDLLDKDGNIIGSGTTDDTVMSQLHRQNLFLKVMSLPKRLICRTSE